MVDAGRVHTAISSPSCPDLDPAHEDLHNLGVVQFTLHFNIRIFSGKTQYSGFSKFL